MLTNGDVAKNDTCESVDDFVENYYKNYHSELVVIIAGSVSDKKHVAKIRESA